MKIGSDRKECKISNVEITTDTLSGRGGLSFMMRYIDNTGICSMIEEKYGHLRKSSKGESIGECARQFMAFSMDGTNHSITRFDEQVPIIFKADSGFLSDENLLFFENELKIKFVVLGKLYSSVYESMRATGVTEGRVTAKRAPWVCYDFKTKLDRWETPRRTILTTLVAEDDQYVLEGIRDTVMYTNLGNDRMDCKLHMCGHGNMVKTEVIVKIAHHNREEGLNHRSIKAFMGSEHLPFTTFSMNGAYYALMVISHFLMESFHKDVAREIIPHRWLCNTGASGDNRYRSEDRSYRTPDYFKDYPFSLE